MEFSWGHSRFQGKAFMKAHTTGMSMTVFKKTYCFETGNKGYKMMMKNQNKKKKKEKMGL